MTIPYLMFKAIAMFDLNGQLISTGGAEFANPQAARNMIQMEINEGSAIGLAPVRGVIVEKRGNAEFCSHILPIAAK